jgi:hypothetical protein
MARFAADLNPGAAAGIDVITELPRLTIRDSDSPAVPANSRA